ncbi:MAG TPA: M23 family metallopeptidase [Thermoanaerobaculia bacterium]|nr:M23 family metallopeptidase [Thermoanaerobaculia bacterium]
MRRPAASSRRAPTPRPGGGERSRIEVQIHPGNIRKRVRYLFFTRRQVALLGAVAALWLVLTAGAAVLAPRVAEGLASRAEYRALRAERDRQGDRLEALVDRLAELRGRSESLRLRVDKIFLAYGLSSADSRGQGGYPAPVAAVPRSIYANDVRRGLTLSAELADELAAVGAFLEEVHAFEQAHGEQVRLTPSASPLRGERFVLTSPFGRRRSPFTKNLDFHAGVDLAAASGTAIHAPADGEVVFAGRYPLNRSVGWWRYGNLVVIAHGDEFRTLFGHCKDVKVSRGQRVSQGDVIATVGNTGWSTSPHLHYEVRRRDAAGEFEPIDPRIYILDRRWRDEERVLVAARTPDAGNYEPLPPLLAR